MSEDAAYYEAHKDDDTLWGDPEPPPSPRRRGGGLGATITVRFSEQEAAEIYTLAQLTHRTYSAIVREAVTRYLHPTYTITSGSTTLINYYPRPQGD